MVMALKPQTSPCSRFTPANRSRTKLLRKLYADNVQLHSKEEDERVGRACADSATERGGCLACRLRVFTCSFQAICSFASMPVFNAEDAVELLDGGEVVAKGNIVGVDDTCTIHGQPMPVGHVSVSVTRVLNGTVHIPHPPPHEPKIQTLHQVLGYIIALPRVAIALEGARPSRSRPSHSRSSRQSHSSGSSHSSKSSRYDSMSEEDFREYARTRGYAKKDGVDEATSRGDEGCCGLSCFGAGGSSKRHAPPQSLETVYEDSDQNFEFRPRTQLQFEEPSNRWTLDDTPGTTEPPTPAVETTPLSTPAATPETTPPMTPFQQNLYYEIDEDGDVVSNAKGKQVLACMHKLMWVYFPADILTDWRRQPADSKNAVLDALHREFPNPASHRFRDKTMLSMMNHVLKSRRGTAREAASEGNIKPPGLSHDDWRKVLEERRSLPNRWDQQKEANRVQQETTGISRLGSGGKAHFYARFEEEVGRKPTRTEYEEERDNGLKALIQRMKNDGVNSTPRRQEQTSAGPSSYGAAGPSVEMESEEDLSYVPSDDVDSEDTAMEIEDDADIWLQDVEHPTSSRRPKYNRW